MLLRGTTMYHWSDSLPIPYYLQIETRHLYEATPHSGLICISRDSLCDRRGISQEKDAMQAHRISPAKERETVPAIPVYMY